MATSFSPIGFLLCATYFGQNHDEDGHIAVDLSGDVYLAGGTNSLSGITSSGFQNNFGGGGTDAYLVKFSSKCLEVGMQENQDLQTLSFFPNPSTGKFIIQTGSIKSKIEILNSFGSRINSFEIDSQETEIDLNKQPNGVYFIFCISERQLIIRKLILNHR